MSAHKLKDSLEILGSINVHKLSWIGEVKELYGVGVLFYNVAAAHSFGKGEELGEELLGEAYGRANLPVGGRSPYKRAFAFC